MTIYCSSCNQVFSAGHECPGPAYDGFAESNNAQTSLVNDGGPAFPVAENHRVAADLPWTGGMTLRDWFAGQALAGYCANPVIFDRFGLLPENVAPECYGIADAMLAQREKQP